MGYIDGKVLPSTRPDPLDIFFYGTMLGNMVCKGRERDLTACSYDLSPICKSQRSARVQCIGEWQPSCARLVKPVHMCRAFGERASCGSHGLLSEACRARVQEGGWISEVQEALCRLQEPLPAQ